MKEKKRKKCITKVVIFKTQHTSKAMCGLKANDDREKGPGVYEQQIWLMIYDDVRFYSLAL